MALKRCAMFTTVLRYRKNKALNANLNKLEAQLYGFATLTVKVNKLTTAVSLFSTAKQSYCVLSRLAGQITTFARTVVQWFSVSHIDADRIFSGGSKHLRCWILQCTYRLYSLSSFTWAWVRNGFDRHYNFTLNFLQEIN